MSFELPQNYVEWIPFLVPAITLLVGLIYFFIPKTALAVIGLEGSAKHPEGYGDGRSTFAGFAIGLPVIAMLFQQPILYQTLTIAWILIAVGRLAHFLIDGGYREKILLNLLRLAIAGAIAVWSFLQTGLPENLAEYEFAFPQTLAQQLPMIAAAITVLFGLIAIITPSFALRIIRMRPMPETPSAKGEPRGLMAGMYLAVGGLALIYPDVTSVPGVFLGITLGVCWIVAAFGRMIAILSDNCNNLFNWLSMLSELALAVLPLVVIFNLLPK